MHKGFHSTLKAYTISLGITNCNRQQDAFVGDDCVCACVCVGVCVLDWFVIVGSHRDAEARI